MTADEIKQHLKLQAHPEGGLYRETYRGGSQIKLESGKVRNTSTAIYYMLRGSDKSHFHKVKSDELWFLHQGEALEILSISDEGELLTEVLGNRLDLGEQPQLLVKANTWFAAKIKNEQGFVLVSCVVAPGFEFEDFEMADKQELLRQYPHLQDTIEELTM